MPAEPSVILRRLCGHRRFDDRVDKYPRHRVGDQAAKEDQIEDQQEDEKGPAGGPVFRPLGGAARFGIADITPGAWHDDYFLVGGGV